MYSTLSPISFPLPPFPPSDPFVVLETPPLCFSSRHSVQSFCSHSSPFPFTHSHTHPLRPLCLYTCVHTLAHATQAILLYVTSTLVLDICLAIHLPFCTYLGLPPVQLVLRGLHAFHGHIAGHFFFLYLREASSELRLQPASHIWRALGVDACSSRSTCRSRNGPRHHGSRA